MKSDLTQMFLVRYVVDFFFDFFPFFFIQKKKKKGKKQRFGWILGGGEMFEILMIKNVLRTFMTWHELNIEFNIEKEVLWVLQSRVNLNLSGLAN